VLEEQLKKPIITFAYPYGLYNNKVANAVKEAGYIFARSADTGVMQNKNNIFNIKGVLIFNYSDLNSVLNK